MAIKFVVVLLAAVAIAAASSERDAPGASSRNLHKRQTFPGNMQEWFNQFQGGNLPFKPPQFGQFGQFGQLPSFPGSSGSNESPENQNS